MLTIEYYNHYIGAGRRRDSCLVVEWGDVLGLDVVADEVVASPISIPIVLHGRPILSIAPTL